MHGGRAQRDASLYSILLHRMNYLLSQCSESAFDFIEPLLLRWALTGSGERGSASGVPGSGLGSPLCSALASDAICFIVRLAAPDVGWNLTMTTAELHERIVGKDGEIGQNGTMISCEGMNGLKVRCSDLGLGTCFVCICHLGIFSILTPSLTAPTESPSSSLLFLVFFTTDRIS